MDEAKALALKSGGKEAGLPEEPPDSRPRRVRFMRLFMALPVLSTLSVAGTSAVQLVPAFLVSVLLLSFAYVAGFMATTVLDLILRGADMVLWPVLRWLGRHMAAAVGGNIRHSYFPPEADDTEFWEQQRYTGLIPDDEWTASVGALTFSYLCFAAVCLAELSGWALDPLPAMILLSAWAVALYLVGKQAVRTLLLPHRVTHGAWWTLLEAGALARRTGKRLYYLTQPALQLEEGVASEEVRCPYCSDPIGEERAVACETCHTPHHKDCWSAFGRCTMYACKGEVSRSLG